MFSQFVILKMCVLGLLILINKCCCFFKNVELVLGSVNISPAPALRKRCTRVDDWSGE